MPLGHIATRVGGIMASEDNFVIRIQGRGGHAARPHMAVDPLVIAAEIILALQTLVARPVDPGEPAVVSCTEIFSDAICNALPSNVTIKGDTRSYLPHVQALLERRMRKLCQGICAAHGAQCEVAYTHELAPTVTGRNTCPWLPPRAATAAFHCTTAPTTSTMACCPSARGISPNWTASGCLQKARKIQASDACRPGLTH